MLLTFAFRSSVNTHDVKGERTGEVDVGAVWPVWWMVSSWAGPGGINMFDDQIYEKEENSNVSAIEKRMNEWMNE